MADDIFDEALARQGAAEQDWVDAFLARHGEAYPADYDLEVEAISERIVFVAETMKRQQAAVLRTHGLSWEEFNVLENLALHGGAASPGQIGRDLRLTTGAITNRLDRLEGRQFVERRPNPDDRRAITVVLTPEGRQTFTTAIGAAGRNEALTAAVLTRREQKELNRLLRKLALAYIRVGEAAGDRRLLREAAWLTRPPAQDR